MPAGSDKVVHVIAYAVLGVLVRSGLGPGLHRPLVATCATVLIVTAYGAVDEVHQSFVPGRSPSVADGIADAVGAILGAWLGTSGIVGRLRAATRRRP